MMYIHSNNEIDKRINISKIANNISTVGLPLPLTVSCFSKIQIGCTFLVPAHPGSPGQRAVMYCSAE